MSSRSNVSSFISDTYATRLYATCEGYPLWNPSVLTLGDIGYIRQGAFYPLYNVERGPAPDLPSFSEETRMARRTSGNGTVPTIATASDPNTPATVNSDLPGAESDRRRSSLSRMLSHMSYGQNFGGSAMYEHPASPMALTVDREEPRIFNTGPRMSTNYRNLGFTVGASIPAATGLPVSATMSFETIGGTGALLVAKDPIHRYLLRHRGVLKAYFTAHRDYIYEAYGRSEDVCADDMVLIYGQDCTTDWACAVTLQAERGSKVEFEMFSFLETGIWGQWKTACSASQRGPYRCQSSAIDINRQVDQSIVVKRLTMQSRKFLPMRLRANAEPHRDGPSRDNTDTVDLLRASYDDTAATGICDPLDMVHGYLRENSKADYSIASDDDALNLLRLVERWDDYSDLKTKLWKIAKEKTSIIEDKSGVAMMKFDTGRSRRCSEQQSPNMSRNTSSSDISAY